MSGGIKGWQGVDCGLAGSVCPHGPAGVSAASGDIERLLGGVWDVRGHGGSIRECRGVRGALGDGRECRCLGPAGVSVASVGS